MLFILFFFKQKTAYEMRISDWSSDVCSSDLLRRTFTDPAREWHRFGGNEPDRRANDRRHAYRTAALHARSASSLSVVAPAESQSRFMKGKTMYIFRLSLVLGIAGLTAACGQKAETPDSSEMTGSPDNMALAPAAATQHGRASCRERVCQYV